MTWIRVFVLSLSVLALACGSDADGGEGDGDGNGQVDAGPGGDIVFMATCDVDDDQCVSGEFCFAYGEGGSLCTHECETADDCPAPSSGCNRKGICKKP